MYEPIESFHDLLAATTCLPKTYGRSSIASTVHKLGSYPMPKQQLDLAPHHIFMYAGVLLERFDRSQVLYRACELSYLLMASCMNNGILDYVALARNGIHPDPALTCYQVKSQLLYQST